MIIMINLSLSYYIEKWYMEEVNLIQEHRGSGSAMIPIV